jgi:dTDP-4-dehydrorhamnose reductase
VYIATDCKNNTSEKYLEITPSMNILIFGKYGQLGKAFKTIFDAKNIERMHRIHYVDRIQCDFVNSISIHEALNHLKPDLIINAAAYTAVDKAETEIDTAFAINAKAPEIMAQYAVSHGATLVHYSTDYVFDGKKSGFYTEDDLRNPLGAYGKSKAAGEEAIETAFKNLPVKSQAQYAIFRTSWVYGDGVNFIRTILRLAKEREELKVISDQHGAPTSAQWLAGVSLDLALCEDGKIQRFPSGIYHAVPSGETTWHGLASLAIECAIEAGVVLNTKLGAIKPILAVEYRLPAPRPMNSKMATGKLRGILANPALEISNFYNESKVRPDFPVWDVMVCDYVKRLAAKRAI